MPASSTRPGGWRNLGLGVAFAVLGVVGFLQGPADLRWQLGGAGVFLGAFVAVVLGPWSQSQLPAPGVDESRRTLEGLVEDLGIEGPAFVVGDRAQPHLREPRLFLAEHGLDHEDLPELDPGATLYTGEASGLATVPPGMGLLEAHQSAQDVQLDQLSLGELDTMLGSLVPGNRLVEKLTIRHVGEAGRVRVRYAPLGGEALHPLDREEIEADGTEELEGTTRQTAVRIASSPVATALLVAVTNAVEAPLRVETLRTRTAGEIEVEVTYPP